MSEKLTAEERAIRIARWYVTEGVLSMAPYHVFNIAEQIKEAEAQAFEEGKAFGITRSREIDDKLGYEKGWIACREAAKKVCSAHGKRLRFEDSYQEGRHDMADIISQEIESLQPPSEAGR